MTDFLQLLNDLDSQLLLAINGLHNPYFDTFMYAYSGKWIWIPMYAALVYVLFRNLSWRVALACLVGVALTITFADQIGASVIRPWVELLPPATLEHPLSEYVPRVTGYGSGSDGFPSCHAANTFGLTFYLMFLIRRRGFTLFMCAWALLTCYARSYLGVHYPVDFVSCGLLVLCGAVLMYGRFRLLVGYRRLQHFKDLWVPMVTGVLTVAGMLVYAAF